MFSGSARSGQQGLTLIEVLLAVGILAAVAVTFLMAISTSTKASMVNNEQITAEGLAKSQIEFIKRQPYDAIGAIDYTELDAAQVPAGYDIVIVAELMNPRGDGEHNDDGLQMITINIVRTHDGATLYTLQGYKCFIGQ